MIIDLTLLKYFEWYFIVVVLIKVLKVFLLWYREDFLIEKVVVRIKVIEGDYGIDYLELKLCLVI